MSAANLAIAAVSMDCPDHERLARFYIELLSGQLMWSTSTAAAVRCGSYVLVAQRCDPYVAPQWPGASLLHLDLNGDEEIDELVRHARSVGATLAEHQPDTRWTVLLDPAGHPFCVTPFSPLKD